MKPSQETVLVTGYRGFIGSHLWEALKHRSRIGIDRKEGQEILDCELPSAGLVYHLAAHTNVVDSVIDPISDARDNVLATSRIVQRYYDKRIIYPASGASIDPLSPYGVSKLAGEHYVKLSKNWVIVRFPNIFDESANQGLIPTILKSDVITIYGDGEQTRDFVNVSDAVRALKEAASWPSGEYSISSGKSTKIIDIAKATGKEIRFLPPRPGEKIESSLQNTAPGWEATVDVLDYVIRRSGHSA